MKIGIDISQIIYGTGASRYTENLVENLLKIDRKNEYVLFGGSLRRIKDLRFKIHQFKDCYKSKVLPIPPVLADLIWNRLHILNIELLTGKLDVFHSSDWTQPPARAFRVTTIHDLSLIRFPRETHPRVVAVHGRRLAWVKKEIDRVIVPSLSTKDDLMELGFRSNQIRVIPEAPDETFTRKNVEEIKRVRMKYKIWGKYALIVGTSLRKNLMRQIEAFEIAKTEIDFDHLVIVGEKKDKMEERRGVIFVGFVPKSELPAFYSGAEVFLYASLYEGFGLPILEAMACGCPVVTSNVSSMPEVAGSAAVLVDPNDARSIVSGIKKSIKGRQKFVEKGFKRVNKFSWERTAKETLEVYKEAL